MINFCSKISGKSFLLFCCVIIIFINLPYFVLGQGFYEIFGYDNLDSNVIWYKLLVESGKLFSDNSSIILQPISGLERLGFPSELSFGTLLYVIFNPPLAYVINIVLIQIIAFFGMQLLLKEKYKSQNIVLIYTISLVFSQLNFWPHAGISIAGLPLIYFAYLKFSDKPIVSIFILLFYASYSDLVTVGVFLIAILSLDILYKISIKEKYFRNLIFILLLFVSYLIVEYRLVLSVFDPVFISHRTEIAGSTFGIRETLSPFIKLIFREYGHNVKKPELIVLTTILFISFALFRKSSIGKDIFQIIILIVFLSAITVFIQSSFLYSFTSKFELLRTIQLQRFYWLLPPLYYILFFLVLEKIYEFSSGRLIVVFLILFQFGYVVSANTNLKQIVKTKVLNKEAGVITYGQFYSEKLYSEIKNYIGKDQALFRVASLGLQPAAALYNGFYTIDGYFPNYPIKYKKRFYKIIEKELEKNKIAHDFFIYGGHMCILLSDEEICRLNGHGFIIPTFHKAEKNRIIHHLDINTEVMRGMNCQYLFSAFQIENANNLSLKFEKYFEREDSPYGIFLYSLN